MYRFLASITCFLGLTSLGYSQAELSPISFSNPFPSTVTLGEMASFSVFVENTGDSIYQGPLSLMLRTDNGATQYEQVIYSIYTDQNPVSLAPGAYIEINGSDSIASERYSVDDNTIVVWPTGNAVTRDSLETQTFVIDPNGIEDNLMSVGMVSPNPAKNYLNIHNLNLEEINIYDVSGRLVMKKNQELNKLDVSQLTQGVYIVQLKIKDQSNPLIEKLFIR